MTFWPLLICTGLYVVTACGFAREGNGPMAVAFGAMLWLTLVFSGWLGGNPIGFDGLRLCISRCTLKPLVYSEDCKSMHKGRGQGIPPQRAARFIFPPLTPAIYARRLAR